MNKILCSLFLLATAAGSAQHWTGTASMVDRNNKAMYYRSAFRVHDDTASFIEDETAKNEIGFDLDYFLQLFRSTYEGQPSSVFSFAYNRDIFDKMVWRTTIGFGFARNTVTATNASPTQTKLSEYIFRSGLAWEIKTFHRWKLYYGFDLESQYGYNFYQLYNGVDTSITTNIEKYFNVGPGPFVGLTFYINPRVSLSIESNLHVVYSVYTYSEDNNRDNLPQATSESSGVSTIFITPQSLFLNVKF